MEAPGKARLFFRRARCESGAVHAGARSETKAGATGTAAELFCLSLRGDRRERISKCFSRVLVRGRHRQDGDCSTDRLAVKAPCASHVSCGCMARRPTIGVFDSGVGGLTVLRALV